MKPSHQSYIQEVRTGPAGLFSRGDTLRLEDHVLDALVAAPLLRALRVVSIVDVGSGGGTPSLPLAIELSTCSMTLVESLGWKCEFLRACSHALDLDSRVSVLECRAEEAPHRTGRELFDAGTARALARPVIVAEYLSPLVRPGGHLILWSTQAMVDDAGNDIGAWPELGLGEPAVHPAPSSLRTDGALLVWPKIAACSDRFPRRIGVAAKRPLRRS